MARYYLKEKVDAAKAYREALSGEECNRLTISILGLGETGGADDAETLIAFTKDRSPRIRAAAVKAIARLAAEKQASALLDAVGDASTRVSRMAVRALTPLARRLEQQIEQRMPEWLTQARPLVRRQALLLASRLFHWQQPAYLLPAVADEDPRVSAVAKGLLQRWISRRGTVPLAPRDDQLAVARQAYESVKHHLRQSTRQRLDETLGWRR